MIVIRPEVILEVLLSRFPGTHALAAWGETSIFYNPGHVLPRGVYFATVKEKDGDNDRASNLSREGIFRFNVGTTRLLFEERFGGPPSRPAKGQAIQGPWDFTGLDIVTPHPVYGWMSWVSVLNPSEDTMNDLDPMIRAAFNKAKAAFEKKAGSKSSRS
jgi:hypothetical protein